ncbi:rnp-1 [Pristionchus pacificus]|uniref:Rnp-1 n=1 Tax=Pristionchus pacificus TaxID=54126 RepID=A0A2A6CTD0_PRIPA|nr:rnp-1 [Pristionchus pacificus]|eukprot:PDM81346.1 rnp-1 [Pristionchus pacificus]
MVKLFVGNLTERINTDRLKELFAPHCRVTECDVLKNYAFVHIPDDTNVDELIKRLDGSTLDGRAIHIERSTSRLRKQPGMSDKCFRCGSTEHKTTNCPHNEKNTDTSNATIKIDLTNSGKRPYSGAMDGPAAKQPSSHGYYAGGPSVPAAAPVAVATPGVIDPEITRPVYGDLQALYDQYAESRQRYQYFRDRLLKEMQSRATGIPTMAAPTIPTQTTMGTQVTAHPVTYLTQQPTSLLQQQPLQQASHPYANAAGLKAPYQMGVGQQQPQVMTQQYAVQQTPIPIQQTPSYVSQAQPIYQQVQQHQYQQQQPVVYQQVTQQQTAPVAVNGTPGGYRWN